ncbi:winged helix-turn-helix transcriptional regulator [Bdellovibrio bacteriovorus]|uniref:winged helix-turn-helix transcriptional regulator n=1 Tax=Bdellovibrio bacteriovorus TaxID=959 RepID=UPI0009BC9A75|nr:helix-turn-helix domain-containing protein [Bdellovibrio bacteriovorus]
MNKRTEKEVLNHKVETTLERVIKKPLFDETCIFSVAARFLGDKWTMIVLVALLERTKRYNELQKQIPTISPKMLAQTLKSLEEWGFISREVYPEIPPRVEYSLTPFGRSLMPTLSVLFDWAIENESKLRKIK